MFQIGDRVRRRADSPRAEEYGNTVFEVVGVDRRWISLDPTGPDKSGGPYVAGYFERVEDTPKEAPTTDVVSYFTGGIDDTGYPNIADWSLSVERLVDSVPLYAGDFAYVYEIRRIGTIRVKTTAEFQPG